MNKEWYLKRQIRRFPKVFNEPPGIACDRRGGHDFNWRYRIEPSPLQENVVLTLSKPGTLPGGGRSRTKKKGVSKDEM